MLSVFRFSTAEIEALRSAAEEYARENNMSDTDFDWMFSKGKGKKKGASAHWPILTERALPHRSVRSVYNHGLRLFGNYKKVDQAPCIATCIFGCLTILRRSRWECVILWDFLELMPWSILKEKALDHHLDLALLQLTRWLLWAARLYNTTSDHP